MKSLIFILLFCINLIAGQRIITLSPSINEIVYALGLGKNVVGNTLYCNYPPESKSVQKVGGYSTISIEKILLLNPDIILSQDYDKNLLSNLEKLKINTKVFKTNTLNDIIKSIKDLGIYFKKENEADKLILSINQNLLALKNIIKNKKIMVVFSPRTNLNNQIYISSNDIYFEDIIKASGNINAYQSTSLLQPVVNAEKIIKMNPDIIVLLAPFLANNLSKQNEIKNAWYDLPISAAEKKNVFIISKFYAGIPSHRVQYFINDFRKILINVNNK